MTILGRRGFGENGQDNMHGFENRDDMFGGSGDDQILGLNDNDTLYGNEDTDLLVGGNGVDACLAAPPAGDDNDNQTCEGVPA